MRINLRAVPIRRFRWGCLMKISYSRNIDVVRPPVMAALIFMCDGECCSFVFNVCMCSVGNFRYMIESFGIIVRKSFVRTQFFYINGREDIVCDRPNECILVFMCDHIDIYCRKPYKFHQKASDKKN